MKKKVIKLTDVPDASFSLVGISSHENDYRLSWAINKTLDINLIRTSNYFFTDQKNNIKKEFSQYEYNDEELLIKLLLVSNQSDSGYLLSELKNIDFFIVISGETDLHYINQLIQNLKKVDIISMATLIIPESVKSYKNLFF